MRPVSSFGAVDGLTCLFGVVRLTYGTERIKCLMVSVIFLPLTIRPLVCAGEGQTDDGQMTARLRDTCPVAGSRFPDNDSITSASPVSF